MTSETTGDRKILVTGATGRQGGAVVRHLLKAGYPVRALARNPSSPAAQGLAKQGVEVVKGDMDDATSVKGALEGAYGVYSVQNFWETGYDKEIAQGVSLAAAAKSAGVEHFIYSSVGSADRDTGLPHFDSKWKIELKIQALDLPHTIFRPVFFMDNWEMPMLRDAILSGTLAQPLDPDRPLQQVAVDDIGGFVALAFQSPESWLGRAVDLAGEDLTMPRAAETFSKVIGRPVSYVQVPWDDFLEAAGEEYHKMYRWFSEAGYEADIPALRKEYPALTTLQTYLEGQDWAGAQPSSPSDG